MKMKRDDYKDLEVGMVVLNTASGSHGMVVSMAENPTKKTIKWANGGSIGEELTRDSFCVLQFCEIVYKPLNKINNTMKITNLVKKILDKDTRTLVSAGFINGDLALTDDGVSELLGILFLQNKDELVKIATEKIEEKA